MSGFSEEVWQRNEGVGAISPEAQGCCQVVEPVGAVFYANPQAPSDQACFSQPTARSPDAPRNGDPRGA
eukprot:9466518-Pyramimonas_sp.AAC.1